MGMKQEPVQLSAPRKWFRLLVSGVVTDDEDSLCVAECGTQCIALVVGNPSALYRALRRAKHIAFTVHVGSSLSPKRVTGDDISCSVRVRLAHILAHARSLELTRASRLCRHGERRVLDEFCLALDARGTSVRNKPRGVGLLSHLERIFDLHGRPCVWLDHCRGGPPSEEEQDFQRSAFEPSSKKGLVVTALPFGFRATRMRQSRRATARAAALERHRLLLPLPEHVSPPKAPHQSMRGPQPG